MTSKGFSQHSLKDLDRKLRIGHSAILIKEKGEKKKDKRGEKVRGDVILNDYHNGHIYYIGKLTKKKGKRGPIYHIRSNNTYQGAMISVNGETRDLHFKRKIEEKLVPYFQGVFYAPDQKTLEERMEKYFNNN